MVDPKSSLVGLSDGLVDPKSSNVGLFDGFVDPCRVVFLDSPMVQLRGPVYVEQF